MLQEQQSSLLQRIQAMSQQEELESEMGAQDQLRRRLLEQQQQQFDREIGQVIFSNSEFQIVMKILTFREKKILYFIWRYGG